MHISDVKPTTTEQYSLNNVLNIPEIFRRIFITWYPIHQHLQKTQNICQHYKRFILVKKYASWNTLLSRLTSQICIWCNIVQFPLPYISEDPDSGGMGIWSISAVLRCRVIYQAYCCQQIESYLNWCVAITQLRER